MRSFKDRSLIELLLFRLERISVDSYWAHRASGVRGSLITFLDRKDDSSSLSNADIEQITDLGFYILEQAAKNK